MSKGYVYVLSNELMPGIVKIGYSKHGGKNRADTFYRNDTAVGLPFKVEFEIFCDNAARIEREVHEDLICDRSNPSREFFKCSVKTATTIILANLGISQSHITPDILKIVDLDYDDGGTYHHLSSLETQNGVFVSKHEYALAVKKASKDVDLLLDKVEKARSNKGKSPVNVYLSSLEVSQ